MAKRTTKAAPPADTPPSAADDAALLYGASADETIVGAGAMPGIDTIFGGADPVDSLSPSDTFGDLDGDTTVVGADSPPPITIPAKPVGNDGVTSGPVTGGFVMQLGTHGRAKPVTVVILLPPGVAFHEFPVAARFEAARTILLHQHPDTVPDDWFEVGETVEARLPEGWAGFILTSA